jgi:hypothetical protein
MHTGLMIIQKREAHKASLLFNPDFSLRSLFKPPWRKWSPNKWQSSAEYRWTHRAVKATGNWRKKYWRRSAGVPQICTKLPFWILGWVLSHTWIEQDYGSPPKSNRWRWWRPTASQTLGHSFWGRQSTRGTGASYSAPTSCPSCFPRSLPHK